MRAIPEVRDVELPDEAATSALARCVAATLAGGLVMYLEGSLGAGKTSFARALLRTLGVTTRIKSPTYTLVEFYPLARGQAWHLDLYRIADPAELEWLGLDALADADALVLVEWPEHGAGALPPADLLVHLEHAGSGRRASLVPRSARGEAILRRLDD
jgi:tRNA threonylcarbamoyladenosine biosynthesis protein TsaE